MLICKEKTSFCRSGYGAYVSKTCVVLFEAAVAAGYGLSREEALRSITIDAARVLGIEGRVGSLQEGKDADQEGKDADLVLYDGDPLEYTTHVCTVLIGGEVVSDECR